MLSPFPYLEERALWRLWCGR